jgi:hypothetical protein
MAGQLPSFLSSAKLEIRIGGSVIAYATSLSFSDDMSNVPVGGIGSFSYATNEPVGYLARGSMVITQYSDKVLSALKKVAPPVGSTASPDSALPANLQTAKSNSAVRDGNSMLIQEYFSPVALLTQRTFDIEIYEKGASGTVDLKSQAGVGALYIIKDCRMTGYNLSFTPGQLLSESVSFLSLSVLDSQSEQGTKLQPYVKA